MKKALSVILALTLIFTLCITALGATAPTITEQPQSYTYPSSSHALSYSVTASGDDLSYHWYLKMNNNATVDTLDDQLSDDFSGGDQREFHITKAEKYKLGYYAYCVVSNSAGSVTSQSAQIKVEDGACEPVSIKVPNEINVSLGEKAEIKCETGEAVEIEYQWLETATGTIADASDIKGATSQSFNAPTDKSGTKKYICRVTVKQDGKSNTSYSSAVTVNVQDSSVTGIVIVRNPDKTTYAVGEMLNLKGLQVKLVTDKGESVLADGEGVMASPERFDKVGNTVVTVSLGEAKATFNVTVVKSTGVEADGTVVGNDEVTDDTSNTVGNVTDQDYRNGDTSWLLIVLIVIIVIAVVGAIGLGIWMFINKKNEAKAPVRRPAPAPRRRAASKRDDLDEIDDYIDYGD